MKPLIRFTKVACTSPIVKRALKVTFIVGTILNLINQGEVLLHLNLENVNLSKLLLTYLVPYLVTTYTAVALKLEFTIGKYAAIETDLECKRCKEHIHIQESQLIPECENCGIKTRWRAI